MSAICQTMGDIVVMMGWKTQKARLHITKSRLRKINFPSVYFPSATAWDRLSSILEYFAPGMFIFIIGFLS